MIVLKSYLKVTYWHAFHFTAPRVVVFLGDLMDEAHIARDEHFYQYVRRIFNIFVHPYSQYEVKVSGCYIKSFWRVIWFCSTFGCLATMI